jgi:hypothetical protein
METVTTPSQAVGEGRDAGPAERLVHVERVDDLPVLFASVQRLGVAELLERQFHNHEHHFGKGELTFGEVVSVWLTFLLSQGDHRLDRLQPWAQEHQRTLQALLGKPVGALDCHDDRLVSRDTNCYEVTGHEPLRAEPAASDHPRLLPCLH